MLIFKKPEKLQEQPIYQPHESSLTFIGGYLYKRGII